MLYPDLISCSFVQIYMNTLKLRMDVKISNTDFSPSCPLDVIIEAGVLVTYELDLKPKQPVNSLDQK